jgi:hypothetical protein
MESRQFFKSFSLPLKGFCPVEKFLNGLFVMLHIKTFRKNAEELACLGLC